MLVPVIKNAPLTGVMAYTRFSKSRMLFYNLEIVFSLTSMRLKY